MRTTLAINEKLLDEAKALSGARSKKEAVEIALGEFIRRSKARKLLDLEGKVEYKILQAYERVQLCAEAHNAAA